jgi:hypothetical protein
MKISHWYLDTIKLFMEWNIPATDEYLFTQSYP